MILTAQVMPCQTLCGALVLTASQSRQFRVSGRATARTMQEGLVMGAFFFSPLANLWATPMSSDRPPYRDAAGK